MRATTVRDGARVAARSTGRVPRPAAVIVAVIAALVALVSLSARPASAAPQTAVVFPSELVDTSTEGDFDGTRADQTARLALITRTLTDGLLASGDYTLVDTAPEAKAIEAAGQIRTCNGCDIDIARRLGAQVSVIAVVQKVSNLILDVHIYVRDVETAKVIRYGSTSIRGNTDESWVRGVRWLLAHRILKNEAPGAAATAAP